MTEKLQIICDNGNVFLSVITALTSFGGLIIGGLITYFIDRWHMKIEASRKVNSAMSMLHTAANSWFSYGYPENDKEKDEAIRELSEAYSNSFSTFQDAYIFLCANVSDPIMEYHSITHHNITVWIGKMRNDPVYIDCKEFPDESQSKGSAHSAYIKSKRALSISKKKRLKK